MKNFIFTILLIGLIISCANMSSQAVVNQQNERGYITINTSAETEIVPDTAEISFSVKTSDPKSMQKAANTNKEISDKVYTILKGMINSNNGDYIKTSDFNATPKYIYSNNKKTFDKYEVSNRITVHTKSIEKLGLMIDKSIDAGATNIDSLNFSVSNYENQCNKLIETATIKAKNRASIAAKGTNSELDGIKYMDISCSNNSNNNPRVYMAKGMLNSASTDTEAVQTNISSGTIKIQANVNAGFFTK